MVEPARSKSIPRKTRSSRGCKGTHSSNPRQGTAPRKGGAVACGLVCLSPCRLRASLHEPGWPDWPGTGPIWVHMRNFSPVSDMRKGQRSRGRVLAQRNKANMEKHKNYNFRAYEYDDASADSLLTDRCLPFTQTTLVEILHINLKL